MAEIKVSQLPEATQINDEDLLMIVQGNANKKITKANAKFASGDEVYIGDTEPTGEDDDSVKIWVEPSEDSVDAEGTYISNTYGVSTEIGYSENYINNCNTYSTDEVDTGKTWIDGSKIYRKVIDLGTFVNTNHNISNLDKVINIYGYAISSSGYLPVNFPNKNGLDYQLSCYVNSTQIKTNKGSELNDITGSYVIIEYTKTTD